VISARKQSLSDEKRAEIARKRGTTMEYKLYQCIQCGFEYDEALGWPEDGIAAGTRWDDIPDDWICPDCGAAKADFEMIEVARA
jgi:rubredoxin